VSRASHVCLMASYNAWMNAKVYEAAASLPAQVLAADKKAFFGSILGTLNHIAVADTIWLKRFASHPAGYAALAPLASLPAAASLDAIVFSELGGLREHRARLDAMIDEWARSISEGDLDHVLHYSNSKGVVSNKDFYSLLMHFFNHQTHHRGQATTLLSQEGLDVGSTDLLALIPNS
jgi:uncharacterized damage-inducible protein DinB